MHINFLYILFLQYSWAKFISTRCSNVNRNNDSDLPKSKRRKVEPLQITSKHQYLHDSQSIVINDSVAYSRNTKKLATELSKVKPSPLVLEDLMKQTFPNRRSSILNGDVGIIQICESFPLLRKPKHVSLKCKTCL